MKRLRLTASFALVSLVAIAAAAFVVSRVSERAATNQMVRAIEHAAAGEAFMIIDEVLLRGRPEDDAGHHAAGPDEAALLETLIANDGLGEEFAAHTKPLNLIGALLFGSDGRLVWSTEPGHETGDGEMFEKALGGEVASRLTRDYATTGPDGEAVRIDVVETYVPVRAMPGGPVIGVFEIYKDATEDQHALVAGAGSSAARRTVYTMGGLFLILLGFVVAADLAMQRARDREREAREQLEERNRRLSDTEAQLQREARESATLAEIGRSVSSSLDIDEVYERVAQAVCAVLPVDWIEIVRIHEERAIATRVAGSGDVWPLQREIALAGTIAGGTIDTAETLLALSDTPEELLERLPGV